MSFAIYPGVMSTATIDTSLTSLQNIWTTRPAPVLGNAVITQAVIRDPVGVTLERTLVVQVFSGTGCLFFMALPYIDTPVSRYVASFVAYYVSGQLQPNPEVYAQITSGNTATSQTLQMDLIGYYI